jgi:hypothetical protein
VTQYNCPSCSAVIEMANINVATDVALCKQCGQTTPFSILSGISELSSVRLDAPPKGIQITEDMTGVQALCYKKISPVVFFLIPFTCLWSGGSMWGIYFTQFTEGKFDLFRSLFGLPFLFGTVILLSIIIFNLFGKWLITINQRECLVFVGVGGIGWTRGFPLTRETVVSLGLSSVSQNHQPMKAICIRNQDKEIKFGSSISDSAKQYIAAYLSRQCHRNF